MNSTINKLEVYEEILAELRCTACDGTMAPPIRMCIFGHSVCDSCSTNLDWCPKCRADLSDTRNFSLENVYNKMYIPCKNQGCQLGTKGADMKDHEENCDYALRNCPLHALDNCGWRGPKLQITDHCSERHFNYVFITNKQNILWLKSNNLRELYGDSYCFLMQAHGGLFKCNCELNYRTRIARWVVTYLGRPKDADQFYYEIKFANNAEEVLASRCQPDNKNWFARGYYVANHIDRLRRFFGPQGLNYCVTIRRYGEEGGLGAVSMDEGIPITLEPTHYFDVASYECGVVFMNIMHAVY